MKTYKNISTVEQLGIDPGQTGQIDIPKDQEDRMVDRGAIEVVTTSTTSEGGSSGTTKTPPDTRAGGKE
jgi:hypothetical protein